MSWQAALLALALLGAAIMALAVFMAAYEAMQTAMREHERRKCRCEGMRRDVTDKYWVDVTWLEEKANRTANRLRIARRDDG